MVNPFILVPLSVWAITQFLKFVLAAAGGRLDFKYLYASGGMPSVHAAVVTSLATTAYLIEGPMSAIFGVTIIFAGIVMYDSFGVRRSAGEQAVAINQILETIDKGGSTQPHKHIRELMGHRPIEVAVGALLGLILGGLFNIDRLGPLLSLLTATSPKAAFYLLAVKGIGIIVIGFVARVILLSRYGKINVVNQAIRRSYITLALVGLVMALLAFLQYENIKQSLWVVWPGLALAILILAIIWLIAQYRQTVPEAVSEHRNLIEKRRWLEGPNKKKRKEKARAKKRS